MNIIREQENSRRKNVLMNILAELKFLSIKDFQKANGLQPDGLFGVSSYSKLYESWLKVRPPKKVFTNFGKEIYPKKQIFLHHSAGSDNGDLMFDSWEKDNRGRVATAIGIIDDGTVIKGYDERFWGGHVGNLNLNRKSIGVELMAYGFLDEKDGEFFTAYPKPKSYKHKISNSKVCSLEKPFKGMKYFEAYTKAQIDSVGKWVLLNSMRFDIPLNYTEAEFIFDIKNRPLILNERLGVYTHAAIEPTKTDCFPQPELLAKLKEILSFER